ncbi:hypothetical protein D3C80_1226770 [compost metagenome]
MAVGVIVQQAVAQPDHNLGAHSIGERSLGGFGSPAGVAVLVQQALARGQDGALAVVVQGAAFEDKVVTRGRHTGKLGDLIGDLVVVRIVVLAAPAVDAEGLGRS